MQLQARHLAQHGLSCATCFPHFLLRGGGSGSPIVPERSIEGKGCRLGPTLLGRGAA